MAVSIPPLTDRRLWVLRLSLLLVVMTSGSSVPRLGAAIVLAAAGLLVPGLIERAWFWFVVFAASAGFTAAAWSTADNHVWLVSYWLLAIAIHQLSPTEGRLRLSARWMIGLVFALAVVWKLRSPEFLSTAFFEFELLTDARFEPVARWGGGLAVSDLQTNVTALAEAGSATELASTSRIDFLAGFLTWGTLIVESAVALAFLLPASDRVRHGSLLIFFAGAYIATPVGGFGFALTVMAMSMTDNHRLQNAYLIVLAALLAWSGFRGLIL